MKRSGDHAILVIKSTKKKTVADMDDQLIWNALLPLFEDFNGPHTFPQKRPLLAHYTSIATLERIMATNEVWFSNPLFMNDVEELRFGMMQGFQKFSSDSRISEACGSKERASKLIQSFNFYFESFSNEHALDVYVFCLSEHDGQNTDGLLSMWRGYG